MSLHVVVGAGPVGSAIACLLAGRGDQVRLVTRSGSGPEHPGIDRRKADATDPEALARLADGAAVLYHCAGPAYHRWPTEFPPLSAAVLQAAEMTGVTDKSAPLLMSMPGLKALNLYHTLVTEKGMQELKGGLPTCAIVFDRDSGLPSRRSK